MNINNDIHITIIVNRLSLQDIMKAILKKYKEFVSGIDPSKPLNSSLKKDISNCMSELKNTINTNGDVNINITIIDNRMGILNKGKLSIEDKKEIINIESIEKIVDEYDKIISTNKSVPKTKKVNKKEKDLRNNSDKCENKIFNDLEINVESEEITAKIIKNKFDDANTYYSKHDINHPMIKISKDRKMYRNRIGEIDKSYKTLEEACDAMKKILHDKLREAKPDCAVLENIEESFIKCSNVAFPIFIHKNDIYFDIQHTLFILEIIDQSHKMAEWEKKINFYYFDKNKFGGYFLRNLLTEQQFLDILLQSQTKFAKKFRKDVSELLVNMRKKGEIIFNNDGKLVKNENNNDIEFEIDDPNMPNNILVPKNTLICNISNLVEQNASKILRPYSYNFVQSVVTFGSNITITKYFKSSVMYFFTTNLTDNLNNIVAKIGYTNNIAERFASLKTIYKCKLSLCNIKYVEHIQNEQQFHKAMELKYPNIKINKAIVDNKTHDELYIFCETIWNEFNNIKEPSSTKNEKNDEITLTNDELQLVKHLSVQSYQFLEYIMQDSYSYIHQLNISDDDKMKFLLQATTYLSDKNNSEYKYYKLTQKVKELELTKQIEEIKANDNIQNAQLNKYKIESDAQIRHAEINAEIKIAGENAKRQMYKFECKKIELEILKHKNN